MSRNVFEKNRTKANMSVPLKSNDGEVVGSIDFEYVEAHGASYSNEVKVIVNFWESEEKPTALVKDAMYFFGNVERTEI